MSEHIPLSEILMEIRNELLSVDLDTKKRENPIMKFEDCEVEFSVSIEKKINAGVKIYVINAGGEAKETNSNKVKIKFKALPGVPVQAEQKSLGTDGPPIDRSQRKTPASTGG